MKKGSVAALFVYSSLALLGCAPALGVLILWRAAPRSEPLVADYLLLATPLGMLLWAVVKSAGWHESQTRSLKFWSGVNTVLLYLDLVGIVGAVIYGCFFSGINPFPPAYSP